MAKNNLYRIGLISDLHGNLVALQSALAALSALGVDQFFCMGDVATSGPNPSETVATLRSLACPVVMGNTDQWALAPQPFQYYNEETPINEAIEQWGAAQLNDDDRAFLRSFKRLITLELGATTILGYHGSPRSNLEDIKSTTPDAQLDEIFAGYSATAHSITVAIGGHTHIQMVRRYHEMLIVNPGSVGAPVLYPHGAAQVQCPPWTEFGVLEVEERPRGSALQLQFHRAPLDIEAIIASARASAMPHAEWYIARWQRGSAGR